MSVRRFAALVVFAVTLPLAVVPAAAGQAAATRHTSRSAIGSDVAIRLDSFSPQAPLLGQTLNLSGTFHTVAANGTGALAVRLRVLAPVNGRDDLTPALNPRGARTSSNIRLVAVAPATNQGDVVPWTMSVPVSQLHLGTAGVYPLAIDAVSGTSIVGSMRTLLPWFPSGTTLTRLGITMVWPIAGVPDVSGLGVYGSEALPQSMSTGGRLDILSSVAAAATGVSPVVDPFLLQAATQAATGYQVASGSNSVPGTQAAAMAQWLVTTQGAMDSNPSALTSYANIDASALLDADQNDLVLDALHLSNVVTASVFAAPNTRPRVFVPQSGWVTPQQALQLAHDGNSAVVVTSDSVPTPRDQTYTSSGRANYSTSKQVAKYVLADSSLSHAVTRASTANPVTLRQRLLGESLLIALELPSVHRTIAVSPLGLWSPSATGAQAVIDGLINTRWTSPVSLTDLIAQDPPVAHHTFRTMPAAIVRQQLQQPQVSEVVAATSPLADVSSVVAPFDAYRATLEQGQLRAASQAWRQLRTAGLAFASNYTAEVKAAQASLTVRSPKTIVIPGESGVLPVTIVNDLPAAASVKVLVEGTPSFRVKVKDSGTISVDPKRRHSLELPITVYGSGSLDLKVRLTSPTGRVVTEPLIVTVRSSAYSRVALIVAGIAFLALLGLSIASITRRIRNRGKDSS